jgi:rare lipoprotein A
MISAIVPSPARELLIELPTLLCRYSRLGDDVKRLAGAKPLGLVAAFAVALSPVPASARAPRRHRDAAERISGPSKPDLSARKRFGRASYYARQFFGRPMADGAPMNPHGDNAASRTLPLGTVAKVTDVATGKSAVVKIEDRGPYIKGRIVDLSPSTARKIGITPHIGVARVVVAPIVVPMPDGRIKLGPAASPASSLGSRRALSPSPKSVGGLPHVEGRSAHGSLAQRAGPSNVRTGS